MNLVGCFARNLEAGRKARGITQVELAQALGVSRDRIMEWELTDGGVSPRVEQVDRIAKILRFPAQRLLFEAPEVFRESLPAAPASRGTRLTREEEDEVIERVEAGEPQRTIAKSLRVHQRSITRVLVRRRAEAT